ncbi:putative tRNA uridine 5-carboxymethylaminomethyl modification protein GidA [Magnetofaba australis IT-1]|uniref:tRNA uridine 5-carboxymethylaminomethyl modification enzyme MnmG n=2 Tax=Magnetofaba TaxID=1472292 RepID=A0A1Y2K2P0_9PROT|nr:putative tRNA uridine 5-carboxymethylaminomethyl modification protein GidA [Magnetofaba australis IT-1]
MGIMADECAINYRVLNRRKGPAVQGTRAQIDKLLYRQTTQKYLAVTKNLTIKQGEAVEVLIKKDVYYVKDQFGEEIITKTVVITSGTFLDGKIHVGQQTYAGGRLAERGANQLSSWLNELGHKPTRLKTGTPPRVSWRSIDRSKIVEQEHDGNDPWFSFLKIKNNNEKKSCWITYTSDETKQIIEENIYKSALYSGQISGVGPRYCPSIEDKVVKFPHNNRHQIFIEPESSYNEEVYLNGISTSLPIEVQYKILKSIPGLEDAVMMRPAYAIEYTAYDSNDLQRSLMSNFKDGLFFAGQINGTTGYEEAAAQGIIAGINAAKFAIGESMLILQRENSYIGVMIDDLISHKIVEPYRMFTSRAEYRILLREKNADKRLTEIGREIGIVDNNRWAQYNISRQKQNMLREVLKQSKVSEGKPSVGFDKIGELGISGSLIQELEAAANSSLYENFERKMYKEIEELKKALHVRVPQEIIWDEIPGLSNEMKEKIKQVSVSTIGDIANINGISNGALNAVVNYIRVKSNG